jgi:hypothetical protein
MEVRVAQSLEEANEQIEVLSANLELVQESMADVVLRMEDRGWQQLMGTLDDADAIGLSTIKNTAKTCRSLALINPLIVRGIAIRTAFIWGNGVRFVPANPTSGKLSEAQPPKAKAKAATPTKKLDPASQSFLDQPNVKKWLASDQAWQEMEKALSTDGNFFMLVSKNTVTARGRRAAKHDVQRIPLDQINGAVCNQDNEEDIWFYKRCWTRKSLDGGMQTRMEVYYPAIDYDDAANGKPSSIGGVPVDYDSRIAVRHAVTKQSGWKWGAPTIWPVMFWAKAHKEYLETQLALAKAYARFAFKATAPTANAAKAAAAKVAAAPGTDPYTGLPNQTGGTFFGAGINLQAVGKPGGAVDMEGGKTLAGYVASGLSVPLADLLADGSHANRSSTETVHESNAKVMQAEQSAYKVFFESIFKFLGMDIRVEFPPINKELVYRQVQAIAQALTLHLLSDKEGRALLADAFEDFDIDPDALPEVMDLQLQLIAQELAARAGGVVDTLPNQSKTPAGGAGQPAGGQTPGGKGSNAKPETANASYGDNGHRSDMGQHAYSRGSNG